MSDKFICVLAQFDDETQAVLTSMQNQLYDQGYMGQHTKGIPHHMTLGYFDCGDEDLLIVKVREVARTIESFDIVLGSIGLFSMKVLYIAPVTNERLLNLQRIFNTDVDNGIGWVPHATILIDESQAVYQAIPILADCFKPFKGRVTGISLYEFHPQRFIIEEKLSDGQ